MIAILFVVVCGLIVLSGCQSDYVSDEVVINEIKELNLFENHLTEDEEYTIIKRRSEKEEDVIYINIEGKNDVYSISVNYKVTYLLYNEGWLLESVEECENINGFINEIKPLSGPTQDEVNKMIDGTDWSLYSSYDKKYIKDSSYKLTDADELELGNDSGSAKYWCEITYTYSYMKEIVRFPIYFTFGIINQVDTRGWYGYKDDTASAIERSVSIAEDICGEWYCEYDYTQAFTMKSYYYKLNLNISSVITKNGKTECVVDSYSFNDGNKIYETKGTMQLVPTFDEDGTISFVKLHWTDGDYNHPSVCAPIEITSLYSLLSKPNDLVLRSTYYSPAQAVDWLTWILNKK